MLKYRMLLSIASGAVVPEAWLDAAKQEPPVRGKAHGCNGCPLRPGGEWEAGCAAALARMTEAQRDRMAKCWGCHEVDRPCAGMTRLCKAAE